jgi:hypothetical protein
VPPRLPATGGPIVIDGIGFRQNSVVSVNGVSATVTSVSPTQITAVAPASAGITGNVLAQVQDPQTLGVAIIADGLSYDAQNGDELAIVTAPANTVALGVPLSFTVKAMNWNNQFPAAGVMVNYAVTYGSAALGCGQITCNVMTAGDGTATIPVSATSNSLAGSQPHSVMERISPRNSPAGCRLRSAPLHPTSIWRLAQLHNLTLRDWS